MRKYLQAVPLQTIVTYGDQKESTPIVKAKTPLWNFWTQMSDEGGTEMMVFSLLERDSSAGKMCALILCSTPKCFLGLCLFVF